MSTVDPSIPLSGTGGFDVSKIANLADLAQQMQMRRVQMGNQNALAQLLANPQSYDPQGNVTPQAQRGIMAANPQVGLAIKDQSLQEQLRKAQEQHYQTESGKALFDYTARIAGASYDAYQDAKTKGANEQDAIAAGTKARNDAITNSGGAIPKDAAAQIMGQPWVPENAKTFAGMSSEWVQERKQSEQIKQDAERNKIAQQHADTQAANELSEERLRLSIEAKNANTAASAQKDEHRKMWGNAPSGYMWDPESNTPKAVAIPGGPKDPNAPKPWTGREKVYTERILGSANQAATAIQNVTELPVSTTSGVLGVFGSHQGGSLFGASFGALKQSMTSQETEDYQSMLAGVSRNLASIETMGLVPAGSLTESMASLVMKPGMSNLTKLRNLAEMRQIVERGMDVPLADPAIPPEIKKLARNVVSTVTTAVPFTQHDVTELERRGEKNPKMTFGDLIKKDELDKPKEGKVERTKSEHPDDIQAILDKYAKP